MADPVMPQAIVDWMRARTWGDHHVQWHVTRIWDLIPADARQWAISQGWSRYPIQEGEAGNGIQFLAMHRVMIRQLIAAFPTHAALFAGWPTPPTNPADPDQPLPGSSTAVITAPMLAAIDTIHNGLAVHPADDGVGRYIETRLRPVPGNPGASSPDPSAGIHNYLHNRWSNDADPVNMGDPAVNIENRIFWRLHGWIDARWTAYRASMGFGEAQASYAAALAEAEAHMGGGHHHDEGLEFAESAGEQVHPPAPIAVPTEIKGMILEALRRRASP